jgi:hypothetical protein
VADTLAPENAPGEQIASCAESAARIRGPNEQLIESAIAGGSRRLDASERAHTTIVDLTKNAGASQLEWLSALAQTHAESIRDVSTAMLEWRDGGRR